MRKFAREKTIICLETIINKKDTSSSLDKSSKSSENEPMKFFSEIFSTIVSWVIFNNSCFDRELNIFSNLPESIYEPCE